MDGYTADEKERVARENIKLVYSVVHKFSNIEHIPEEDKISAAMYGFAYALNGFDKDWGTKFSTLAYKYMEFEMLKLIKYENYRVKVRNFPSFHAKMQDGKEFLTLLAHEDENFNQVESRMFVERIMKRLTEREREVLLHRLEGLTSMEIAEAMGGISRQGVDNHRRNIAVKFKREWEINK